MRYIPVCRIKSWKKGCLLIVAKFYPQDESHVLQSKNGSVIHRSTYLISRFSDQVPLTSVQVPQFRYLSVVTSNQVPLFQYLNLGTSIQVPLFRYLNSGASVQVPQFRYLCLGTSIAVISPPPIKLESYIFELNFVIS